MQSLKTTIKTLMASVWGAITDMVSKFAAAFQEWWTYFRTRLRFAFRNFKGYLILASALITYIELICSLIYPPEVLRKMNILLLISPFFLAPLALILWVFICSLFQKGRESLDKTIGYSVVPLSKRVGNIETTLEEMRKALLICPNRCNITQAGSNFCGQCGSRLIRR